MLKYDSTHGRFKGTVRVLDDSTLEINGKKIFISNKRLWLLSMSLSLPNSYWWGW